MLFMKQQLIQRLSTYAQVDTQANEDSDTCPSTSGQLTLARMLVEELHAIGMQEVTMDENGYVMATLPSNTDKSVPVIGFLAHLDTATEVTGANVRPQVVDNYDGRDIVLNEQAKVILSAQDFPNLSRYQGHTLITTDGTTLLGADNKAGIAEIMTAMAYLIRHPEIKHGQIRVAFTPDEEIGRGPKRFDVAFFGAKYAYTMDGGPLGELQYESFNAAAVTITCLGTNIHPGTAKNKMVNAAKIAMFIHTKLPPQEAPEHTERYEGFYHLQSIQGDIEQTRMHYLIRDFGREQFEHRKARLTEIVEEARSIYGEERVLLEIRDQYYNMREKIEPAKYIVDIAEQAMHKLNIKPEIQPIRGGTDGSQLSYMGLPTPNIFTGGENYHGKYEFISADVMVQATEVIIEIIRLYEERGQ